MADDAPADPDGDLSITALYTAEAWAWAGFDGAEHLATPRGRGVFRATNAVLWLARCVRPRTPSLPHSLAARHTLIDAATRAASPRAVLEVAAGLSRRGLSFSADPSLHYVEVDLPSMVAHKHALLAQTEVGRAALARPNWRRVAADVRALDLDAVAPPGEPLVVIAEGLMMYLEADAQRALWRRVARLLAERPHAVFLFDLVPVVEQPRPGLIGRILDVLMRRFTKGRGFVRDARTREDVRADLLAAGFASVDLLEPPPAHRPPIQALVFRCACEGGRSVDPEEARALGSPDARPTGAR